MALTDNVSDYIEFGPILIPVRALKGISGGCMRSCKPGSNIWPETVSQILIVGSIGCSPSRVVETFAR